jgi:nucleotide-binding universal stress UspA family protein
MTATPGAFTPPSIVVGVDGSRAGERAALWAVDEAVGRDLPLRLVAAADSSADTARAEAAVHAAATAVSATGRQVIVETEVLVGEPAPALLAASRAAAMLCVGAMGLKHSAGTLSGADHRVGSTVSGLVASARCPLAVVRGEHHRGWVVVELDETSDSAAVLQAGVEEARLRAAPLRVLGTWQSDGDGYGPEESARLVRSQLDRRLEIWRHRYPDLDVEPVAVPGSGMAWLTDHGATIQLVVIGARDIVAVTELLGPTGLAALPETAVLVMDPQRLL